MEKAGVPINELRQQIQEKTNQRYQKSWAEATEEFLQSSAGADWQGGAENLAIVGRLIQESNLTEKPSLETLVACWEYMKENNLGKENPAVTARNQAAETEQRIGESMSVEQIRDALGRSSGMFGR
jgi:hypothetical protein